MKNNNTQNPYSLGAVPSPEDSRDYQVADLLPVASSVSAYPANFTTENLPNFVLNQGISNMCVACSLANVRYIQEKSQSRNKDPFSQMYIYGNREYGMYLGEGMHPREALSTLVKYGVCHESDLPGYDTYNNAYHKYKVNKTKLNELAKPFRIDSYYSCMGENAIKSAIMNLGAVSVMYPVYNEFYYPVDGVIEYRSNSPYKNLNGYHQVTLVGWNDKNQWLMLNSWGKGWGNNGYAYIPFEYPMTEAWAMVDNIMEVFFNMVFPDVADNHYARESIEKAANKGVLSGFEDGTFHPDEPLTRAQLAVILDRLGLLG